MTWLPIQGPEQKAAKAKAQEYMAAVIRTLTPLMTKNKARKNCSRYYGGEKQTLLHRDRRCTALCCRGQRRKGADLRC
ncbi:Protein of uncharacterised function (DUF1454) [Escherichia coli]|uniref:Protein of uncharacterized function (DUF1454) n=1 Tax=Escherichia coli TaxID=562 RepID=A0A376WQ03_ECOLX|nr:Protein of uncharacterised function (DUF1454) [Escherichia coli]